MAKLCPECHGDLSKARVPRNSLVAVDTGMSGSWSLPPSNMLESRLLAIMRPSRMLFLKKPAGGRQDRPSNCYQMASSWTSVGLGMSWHTIRLHPPEQLLKVLVLYV